MHHLHDSTAVATQVTGPGAADLIPEVKEEPEEEDVEEDLAVP